MPIIKQSAIIISTKQSLLLLIEHPGHCSRHFTHIISNLHPWKACVLHLLCKKGKTKFKKVKSLARGHMATIQMQFWGPGAQILPGQSAALDSELKI